MTLKTTEIISINRIHRMVFLWCFEGAQYSLSYLSDKNSIQIRASSEYWQHGTYMRKPKHSEKTLSQPHFVHHRSHMDWPFIKIGPPRLQSIYIFLLILFWSTGQSGKVWESSDKAMILLIPGSNGEKSTFTFVLGLQNIQQSHTGPKTNCFSLSPLPPIMHCGGSMLPWQSAT